MRPPAGEQKGTRKVESSTGGSKAKTECHPVKHRSSALQIFLVFLRTDVVKKKKNDLCTV